MGSMADHTSIMAAGVINNIRKISGDFNKTAFYDNNFKKSSFDSNRSFDPQRRRSSLDGNRPSIDSNNKKTSNDGRRRSSISLFNSVNNGTGIGRTSFDATNGNGRSSFDNRRRSSSSLYTGNTNGRSSNDNRRRFSSSGNINGKVSFDMNVKSFTENKKISINSNGLGSISEDENGENSENGENNEKSLTPIMKYQHYSQQNLKTTTNSNSDLKKANSVHFKDDSDIIEDRRGSLHSILRRNTIDEKEEEENVPKPLHAKRLSITFNPIVESNIFIDDPLTEQDETDSTHSSELVDGIKPLGYSYGIYNKSNGKSDNNFSSFDLINESTTVPPLKNKAKSSNFISHVPNPLPPQHRSVYDIKRHNSIHDIVQLYSKDDDFIKFRSKSKINEEDEINDEGNNSLGKSRNSFLNDNYKFEVQQRRKISELNRRRSMYSNGRISINNNLKSSDSLNNEIDTFNTKHKDFNRILSLRYVEIKYFLYKKK